MDYQNYLGYVGDDFVSVKAEAQSAANESGFDMCVVGHPDGYRVKSAALQELDPSIQVHEVCKPETPTDGEKRKVLLLVGATLNFPRGFAQSDAELRERLGKVLERSTANEVICDGFGGDLESLQFKIVEDYAPTSRRERRKLERHGK